MYSGNSKITLIVAAAGVGKRMNLGYPKQFLEINGKPLFLNVLETAEKSRYIEEVIVVTGNESVEFVKELCKINNLLKVSKVVKGGEERQYSIENALEYCEDNSIIGVQDGVRPFLKEKYFSEALNILDENIYIDGVVVGVPLKDTIKRINSMGEVIETPKRDEFIAVHTPQIFRGKILKEAYKKARLEKFLGTDDSSLVERIGGRVKVIIGDYDNIKVTTIEDLKFL
ncbi:2-C-methyl-D-erythritol 4-phosphate cytidylyltransferase [Candidatus Cetobacterium colombiensis]|jgi:2-C-methyl-D-erythritol 4-phosphate cytidylyltransferase|uniref:2-C-methyl-D-erythritol 4-phosphate cytidylyltransferase n=1 Tax=Candidatus Cetobacterium colombiensis TaxID=3073100 RepID=A0ABU4WCY2_9FUSO|nr:2-C-methyl-D-erythritol 4-phosphate cytidylyltransferase [Candidatus Cetobacterium colombiensis]MDX8336426.1 2-C-methyl-D-erythritol 4-phosphate cytidylyltransferase [Candidatus Cetobacterium colombiensis]